MVAPSTILPFNPPSIFLYAIFPKQFATKSDLTSLETQQEKEQYVMQLSDEEKKWLSETMERNQKGLRDSAIFLSIYTNEYQKDPVAVMQFGLAVLSNKPIFVLAKKDQGRICENVKRVARAIEYYDPNDMNDMKEKTQILVTKAQMYIKENS